MSVELTESLLSKAAGWEAMKMARAYLSQGQVLSSFWEPPLLRGVVQAARDYMHQHIDAPIGVPELCEALQVSRRTLQYSFQDVLHLSPVTCLRVLRLNGLRRELLRGDRHASVADCAAHWGFWHLPRLAAEYRALFGELPSQTLQRVRDRVGAAH